MTQASIVTKSMRNEQEHQRIYDPRTDIAVTAQPHPSIQKTTCKRPALTEQQYDWQPADTITQCAA